MFCTLKVPMLYFKNKVTILFDKISAVLGFGKQRKLYLAEMAFLSNYTCLMTISDIIGETLFETFWKIWIVNAFYARLNLTQIFQCAVAFGSYLSTVVECNAQYPYLTDTLHFMWKLKNNHSEVKTKRR